MTTTITLQLNYLLNLAMERANGNPEEYKKGQSGNWVEFNKEGYFVEIQALPTRPDTWNFVISIDTEVVCIEKGQYVSHTWNANSTMIDIILDEVKKYSRR